MGVHSRGVWLCYSLLIAWCATVAVCSPVAQRPAARKRVTNPRVVTEPTTVEPAVYDVANHAPIEPSKNHALADETATLPPSDTSSPILVSLDDGFRGSMDLTNGTFNDTADPEDNTTSSEPADSYGVHSSGDTVVDNLKFACQDDFLMEILALSKEDCANLIMNWTDDEHNEEKSEVKPDEQSEEHYNDPYDEHGDPNFDHE